MKNGSLSFSEGLLATYLLPSITGKHSVLERPYAAGLRLSSLRIQTFLYQYGSQPLPHHRLTFCPEEASSCKPGALRIQHLSLYVGLPATSSLPVDFLSRRGLKLSGGLEPQNLSFSLGLLATSLLPVNFLSRRGLRLQPGASNPQNPSFSVRLPPLTCYWSTLCSGELQD